MIIGITDEEARAQALDPTQSFIVQAPAGSGKTELLTQRFLKLLSCVNMPEEIIAITFTRKASAEMRHRITSALITADNKEKPTEAHKLITFELASKALEQDKLNNWNLIDNPNRLRILTIDALAAFLSAQIPILAGFGSQPGITEHASALYQVAAEQLLSSLTEEPAWKTSLETLLLHLDNKSQQTINLLSRILSKREQWLPHILQHLHNDQAPYKPLEQALTNIAKDSIDDLVSYLDPDTIHQLEFLLNKAAKYLHENGIEHPNTLFINTNQLQPEAEQIHAWRILASTLLTKDDQWRKSITKSLGFPAKTEEKAQMLDMLASFSGDDHLKDILVNIRHTPSTTYSDTQRTMINALIDLLPILYAQLRLVFQQHGEIDFVELNLAALRALGESDNPTDLALYLDHHIQHLLIDEFQDTSITQFTLLEKLTAGWEGNDGRSLFLVGDPMQSIYRFRDAEVGLFLRAEQQGIGLINLTKLTLTQNYRSDKAIIDWVNNTFVHLLPENADIAQGAIPYSPSNPSKDNSDYGAQFYALVDQTQIEEADNIVKIIQKLQDQNSTDTIAILVRSRSHLSDIMPALQKAKITYQAVDLETLILQPEIQDIITLTRALLHREDRIAWLALLRSPICGLRLNDLHLIASAEKSIWQAMNDIALCAALSEDGAIRLSYLTDRLILAFNDQGRKPLDLWIQGVWEILAGTATLNDSQQQDNIASYFKLLAKQLDAQSTIVIDDLLEQLEKTYVEPTQVQTKLSIMTIHKSKGLEFDHVILPGLHKSSGRDNSELMLWLERLNRHGSNDLILATIQHASETHDDVYQYLKRVEKQKQQYELSRLLYVATTRAKQSLHLTACIASNDKGEYLFKSGSFSDKLQAQFLENLIHPSDQIIESKLDATVYLSRLPTEFLTQQKIQPSNNLITDNPLPEAEDRFKRLVGTMIHEIISKPPISFNIEYTHARLKHLGLNINQLPKAIDIIQIAISNMQTDERAQWILTPSHQNSYFEYPVTAYINKKIKHLIIDRTFISDGICWIIDYKTSVPTNNNQADFIKAEKALYERQLTQYAIAMSGLTLLPIKLALYFPIFKGWIEWDHQNQPAQQSLNSTKTPVN